MTSRINVLGISGSLRLKSYNTALLQQARRLAPAGMAIEVASIGDIPLYNGDVEDRGFPGVGRGLPRAIQAGRRAFGSNAGIQLLDSRRIEECV